MRRFRILASAAAVACVTPVLVFAATPAQAATPRCQDRVEERLGSDSVGAFIVRLPETYGGNAKCLMSSSTSVNDGVKALQQNLINCYRMSLETDGIFGNMTKSALRSVQRDLGLTDDGVYGPQTGKAMKWYSYYADTSSKPGVSHGCRSAAQFF